MKELIAKVWRRLRKPITHSRKPHEEILHELQRLVEPSSTSHFESNPDQIQSLEQDYRELKVVLARRVRSLGIQHDEEVEIYIGAYDWFRYYQSQMAFASDFPTHRARAIYIEGERNANRWGNEFARERAATRSQRISLLLEQIGNKTGREI